MNLLQTFHFKLAHYTDLLRDFWHKMQKKTNPKQQPKPQPPSRGPQQGRQGGQTQKPVSLIASATSSGTLQISLVNRTGSSSVWAYITGLAINSSNNSTRVFLLGSDAKTPYYPTSPSSNGSALKQDVAIPLGSPGTTVVATIPYLAGARIWFSQDTKLTFLLNPAASGSSNPGLVEPSIFNPSDPNINVNFAFCEFTFNSAQLFANISYVDFVSALPIAMTLTETSGTVYHVSGMNQSGLNTVCQGLQDQTSKDGRRWSSLIVQNKGQNLRVLSPNSGILLNPSWFQDYWTDYVNKVYSQYSSSALTIDTQASYGNVNGTTNNTNVLTFPGGITFSKPSAKDIFSCSSGPFQTGSNAEQNAIIPRLAAAFNRSTLLQSSNLPNGVTPAKYYTTSPTNHYARIVHAANLDGHGYAFPYDDVAPDGGVPQEGAVNSGQPASFTVLVGGNGAYSC